MPFLHPDSDSPSDADRGIDAFEKLVQDLSTALGPSSGLDSADVDPVHIQRLMEGYVSKSEEWASYALFDPSRTYTRNLIDKGNGKSNLVSWWRSLDSSCNLLAKRTFLSSDVLMLICSTADPGMEPGEGKCNTRSCQRALRDEGMYCQPLLMGIPAVCAIC